MDRRAGWVATPAMKIVVEFERSVEAYAPIAPGAPTPTTPAEMMACSQQPWWTPKTTRMPATGVGTQVSETQTVSAGFKKAPVFRTALDGSEKRLPTACETRRLFVAQIGPTFGASKQPFSGAGSILVVPTWIWCFWKARNKPRAVNEQKQRDDLSPSGTN
jgi:hypothetical protein